MRRSTSRSSASAAPRPFRLGGRPVGRKPLFSLGFPAKCPLNPYALAEIRAEIESDYLDVEGPTCTHIRTYSACGMEFGLGGEAWRVRSSEREGRTRHVRSASRRSTEGIGSPPESATGRRARRRATGERFGTRRIHPRPPGLRAELRARHLELRPGASLDRVQI